MRYKYLPLFMALLVLPVVANAETCTDFDDNGNIIEYDCNRSLSDVIRERNQQQAEIKRQQEIAERAKEEAEKRKQDEIAEQKRIAAEKEKARKQAQREAEQEARRLAREKAREQRQAQKEAKRAAKQKAKADRKQARIDMCSENFWDCVKGRDYYVAFAQTSSDYSMEGYTGEIGIQFNNLYSDWYFITSLSLEKIDVSESGGTISGIYTTGPDDIRSVSMDASKQSIALGLGMGYKIFSFFDVYGKVAPSIYFGEVSNGVGDKTLKKTSFDVGLILGANLRVFKWVNLYAEGQLAPLGFEPMVKNKMDIYNVKNEMTQTGNLSTRIGVKLIF